ncbi:MAG: Single-stranded nucleic acid binding domain protein [Candidatus Saccharibacteria bacterium]|nr:Single-stranded nucleic acid binding domain protein [Candidatus Saccharibacteria bacterium]
MNANESLEFAKKYLADLLTFFEVNVEIEASLEEDVIELSVPSTELNSLLIGKNAETLRSLQYIVSTILRGKDAELTRVNIDVADYKKQREEKIAKQAKEWIEEVLKTGDSKIVHINAADRRIVHHVASEYPNIQTFSEGEGRDRHIVIAQQSS